MLEPLSFSFGFVPSSTLWQFYCFVMVKHINTFAVTFYLNGVKNNTIVLKPDESKEEGTCNHFYSMVWYEVIRCLEIKYALHLVLYITMKAIMFYFPSHSHEWLYVISFIFLRPLHDRKVIGLERAVEHAQWMPYANKMWRTDCYKHLLVKNCSIIYS